MKYTILPFFLLCSALAKAESRATVLVNGRAFDAATEKLKAGDKIKIDCTTNSSSKVSASIRDDAQTFPGSGNKKGKATIEYTVTNEDGRYTGEVLARCVTYGENDKIIDDIVTVDLKTVRIKEQRKITGKIESMTINVFQVPSAKTYVTPKATR